MERGGVLQELIMEFNIFWVETGNNGRVKGLARLCHGFFVKVRIDRQILKY
jgi:hypothetical protein